MDVRERRPRSPLVIRARMTGAALLTILTLCYVKVSLGDAALEKKPITCTKGKKAVGKLSAPGSLTVKCDESLKLNPQEKADVFRTEGCTGGPVALTTLIPGATADDGAEGRTVTVLQMPTADVSVFYLCKKEAKDGEAEQCVVELQVTAASLLGPNICAVQGGYINLELQKVGETAEFGCAMNKQLFPQDANKAFDSTCSKEVDLPAAIIRKPSQNQRYHLDLVELPKAPQKLCFFCAALATAKPNERCDIHVATIGAEGGGAPAVGPRGATALGLGLLVGSWLSN